MGYFDNKEMSYWYKLTHKPQRHKAVQKVKEAKSYIVFFHSDVILKKTKLQRWKILVVDGIV